MIIYAGLSLACWDLTNTELLMNEYDSDNSIRTYTAARLKSLAAVMTAGTVIVLISMNISFQIPFWILLPIAIAALFCIGKAVVFFNNDKI